MKIYISGPIMALHNGEHPPRDIVEMRKERFNKCAAWIRSHCPGWEPVNPLDIGACIDVDAPVKCEEGLENLARHSWQCYLRYDLIALLACEAIVFLPGSDKSPGALLEGHVAEQLMMLPYYANEDGEIVL